MMLDDKSLLSAYLDDELDLAGRLEVESALLTDPRLSEELRQLAGVREMLAGLSRPESSRDLAVEVGARLRGRRAPWPLRGAFPPAIAAAAALLIALPLGWDWFAGQERHKPARPLEAAGGLALAPKSPQRAQFVVEGAGPERLGIEDAPKGPAPEVGQVAARDDDPEAKAREAEQAHIRKLLDSPHLRRVFVVTDVIGGDASERVGALLKQTPRGEPFYGRITISQGIVIDPKHPDQATVFALVMNDRELRQLQAKLDETFPKAVEESIAEPSVVTQLADIGQVAVLSGIAAPDVTIPAAVPSHLALRRSEAGEKALERTQVSPGADFEELAPAGSMGSVDHRRRGKTAHILEGPRRPQGPSAPPETPLDVRAAAAAAVVAREQPAPSGTATASRGSAPSDRVPSSPGSFPERTESPVVITRGGRADAEGRGEPLIVLVWVTTRERRGGDPPSGGPGGRTLEPRGAGG